VATATNLFARSMGSAVGVAIFGALVNAAAGSDPGAHELATGVHRVFFGILLVALAMVLLELGMPRKVESSQLAGD